MLTYDMRDIGSECLYEHLYRCIRTDIESGAIAPGEHLPSKRTFAQHLDVSLITVENAYAQLIAEGYVRALPRRGYFACELPRMDDGRKRAARPGAAWRPTNSSSNSAAKSQAQRTWLANFSSDPAPYDESVVRMWARSVHDVLTQENPATTFSGVQPEGLPALRTSIARYLKGFRGMDVDPSCIVIGAGAQVLYLLIVQLLGKNSIFAIEDPGYRLLDQIYTANGVPCLPIPLNAEGIDIGALQTSTATVAHVMPSHQFPCGTVTSIGRRYQLLAWASEQPTRYLIEDDFDAEFRLAGRPIPSLASIDTEGKVIYLNTFSKSLGPALRVAYMVLPSALMEEFRERLGFYANTVSALDQATLAHLIDSGDYERHINRFRTRHRTRRDALLNALRTADTRDDLRCEEVDSGLHFVLAGPPCSAANRVAAREHAIAERAAKSGVSLDPLSAYALNAKNYIAWQKSQPGGIRPRFVMRYSAVPESVLPEAARIIVKALHE